jgi:hypothetical protein
MTGRKLPKEWVEQCSSKSNRRKVIFFPKQTNLIYVMSNLKASSVGSVSFPATATTFVASASSVFEADPTSSVSVRSEGS